MTAKTAFVQPRTAMVAPPRGEGDRGRNPLVVRIQDVRFEPVGGSLRQRASCPGTFRAEVRFALSAEDEASTASDLLPCTVQIHAISSGNCAPILLISLSERLLPGPPEYVVRLRFTAPPPGEYRLFTVVLLLCDEPCIDLHRGPFLRTVP